MKESKSRSASKCLDYGVNFIGNETPERFVENSFECSECGAVHIYWRGKWLLEDDANDAGRMLGIEILNELKKMVK